MKKYIIGLLVAVFFIGCDDPELDGSQRPLYANQVDLNNPAAAPSSFYLLCGTEFSEVMQFPMSTVQIPKKTKKTCSKILEDEDLLQVLTDFKASHIEEVPETGEFELCLETPNDAVTDLTRDNTLCVNIDSAFDDNITIEELIELEFPE